VRIFHIGRPKMEVSKIVVGVQTKSIWFADRELKKSIGAPGFFDA